VNSDWGEEAARVFKTFAEEVGITISQTLSYDENTEEFVPMLAQVRQAAPTAESSQL